VPPSAGYLHRKLKVTLTLLFDLDDTLLGNNMDQFLPAYFQALSARMASYVDPRCLVKTLRTASAQMLENLRPDRTLEDVFDAGFYPPLGIRKEQVHQVIDNFYLEDFPKLRAITRFNPEAVTLVKTVLERGCQVAIATNSLFPLTAVNQRLSWAGLSPDEFPFAVIPSFQTFHFAKPDPVYFAELMARLAWPEGPVVMVGDSFDNDIASAHLAGLPTFWVTPDDSSFTEEQPDPNGTGKLNDFLPWLDSTDPNLLLPDFNSPSAILACLRATPAFLHTACKNLTREDWIRRPAEGEWSVIEILCHLTDMDSEVNLPRLRKVLRESNPFLVGVDTDAWADSRQYILRDGPQSLQAFIATRLELTAFLEHLSPEDWQRLARHAIFGPTCLKELIIFAAGHDRIHIRQVHQTLT
jgi:FMN phosphatase YigB (HAD superfamily)